MDSEPGQGATKATGPCRFCGAQASLRCSRCRDAFYCCKEHIATDWKCHKRLCVPAEGVTPRPIMIDAILFPVDAVRPRIIKLACRVERDTDPDSPFDIVHTLAVDAYFDREPKDMQMFTPGRGTVMRVSKPGYQLNLYHDDCSRINGSPLNVCVQALTRSPYPWSGNIIGVRSERPLAYCRRFYNASISEDLTRLADVFVRYGTDSYKNEREGVAKWGGRVKHLE